MKKLFVLIPLLVAALVLPVAGQTVTAWSESMNPGTNNITTNGGWLTSVSLTATGATTLVRIFDSSYRSNYIWTPVFTNSARVLVTVTEVYTNVLDGGTAFRSTNTYTALSNSLLSSKWTNVFPMLVSVVVPTNTTYTVTFPGDGIPFTRGLFLTNTAGGTYSVTYRQR